MGYYAAVRAFYRIAEEFSKFQAWVRSEYAKNGYVEVDDDYLRHQQEMEAMNEAARKEALKAFDFSDLLDFWFGAASACDDCRWSSFSPVLSSNDCIMQPM